MAAGERPAGGRKAGAPDADTGSRKRAASKPAVKEEAATEGGVEILDDETPAAASAAESKRPRQTTPFLTKYERARVLGHRALQLTCGSPNRLNLPEVEACRDPKLKKRVKALRANPQRMAEEELKKGVIPFVVRRKFSDGSYEDWRVKELLMRKKF
mmetsp:Transcript_68901/g.165377  ORF Transcript_68901/g.165377 Transcript_68901/m.165377 type:complete len:157 (+) Transcript_68901:58-528(+)